MAIRKQTISVKDLGAGVDQQSSETVIPEGFVENALNADPQSQGSIKTRVGYEGYGGYLPLRVNKLIYKQTEQQICFRFDESINLSNIRSTPIFAFGRTSSATSGGDFSETDTYNWYPGFSTDTRLQFLNGTHTLIKEDFLQPIIWAGTTRSTSLTNNSNDIFYPDAISIDTTTNDLSVTYTNNSSAFTGFIYTVEKPSIVGTTYNSSINTIAPGTSTITILAATHQLSNVNILVRSFQDTGTSYLQVQPDSVTISPLGDVSITITNGQASSIDVFFSLTIAPVANSITGTVAPLSTLSIQIPNLNVGDFPFVGCYLEQTLGGNRTEVIPDSITYDALSKVATVTFQNSSSSSANFFIYYFFVEVPTNILCVDAKNLISADYVDNRPQMTLWGIPHASIYSSSDKRQGWANFIDSYQSTSQSKLVSGLGGNLFVINEQDLPTLYPNLRNRIVSTSVIGPTFYGSFDSPTRTRGFIKGSNIEENSARIVSINWDSGNGWTKLTLSIDNMIISGTLSTIISNLDILNIRQASYKLQNGSFNVKQVANPSSDILEIWVDNPSITSSDYDDADSGAYATIFTDTLNLNTSSNFIEGDILISDIFSDQFIITVTRSTGSTLVIDGVVEEVTAPTGLRVVGKRTSFILPSRNLAETETVENLVRGDLITFTGINRRIRILSMNPNSDISVTLSGDGVSGTLTMGSGNTDGFAIGQKLLLIQAGEYTGLIQITEIPSSTTLKFDSNLTSSSSGTLKGLTLELDEDITWADNQNSLNSFSVTQRWNPIEAPDDSFNLTPSTFITHFAANPYDDQPYFQSVMSSDNLYVNSGDDSPFKYDGQSLYRAGLIRWQPHLFVTKDTNPATGGTIDVQNVTVNVDSLITDDSSNNIGFKVDLTFAGTFEIDKKIQWSIDGQVYTINRIEQDATNLLIYLSSNLSTTGTGTISKVYTYKYYFRLNAVDANNNIIASATVGSEDFVVEFGLDTQVRIRLVGLPAWDIYDYDRLEVQIYRTKANSPLFYRLATLPMSFNENDAYIDYIDTDADDVLFDVDEVSTIFNGVELGNQWSPPLRSIFNTSIQNRLLQANITEDPKLDIKLVDTGSRINVASLTGQRWLFRKDNTDVGTSSNLESRQAYEFRSSGDEQTIDPTTDITGVPGVSVTIAISNTAAAGDWVYLFRDGVFDGAETGLMGLYRLEATSPTSITFLSNQALATYTSDDVNRLVFATNSSDIPVWLGTDGNYGMLNGNRDATGPYEFLAMRRLANNLNASMRWAETPWIVGNAGNEFLSGQLLITQPKVFSNQPIFELLVPTFSGYNLFINDVKRSSGDQVSAVEIRRPSRVICSYPNYPELMDNPTSIIDQDSLSAIDVNTSDGQEITGIIPFFGDSAFGAALKDSISVVFKEHSIYLVNIAEKLAGRNPVQKIESNGQGCTAPRSIASTREGILFANESGLYRLTRDLRVEYIGQKLQRLWNTQVNKKQLLLATGHNYRIANKYKLSFPKTDENSNSGVFVYDHTREYNRELNTPYARTAVGSWAPYDNHPSTGWANLQNDSFFATSNGQVFRIRNSGENTDYRDDASPINLNILMAASDFTDGGIRKVMDRVLVHFRAIADTFGTKLFAARDLSENFEELDPFEIDVLQFGEETGLSDASNQKVVSIRFVTDRRKCLYLQLQITNDTIDEPIEIAGVEYRVAGYSDHGTTEAKGTVK